MRRVFPWSTLGIDADSDEATVRRAYATKLKAMDLDADHQGFDRLREARDHALALARSRAATATEDVGEKEQNEDWLAAENGNDQWQAGHRDYDDDDLPVADDSSNPVAPPAPVDGIYFDVLRSDEQAGKPTSTPMLTGSSDFALTIMPPKIDPERLAGSIHGLDVKDGGNDPSSSNPEFTMATPTLERPFHEEAIVTLAALTHIIDSQLATSQDALYRLLLEADPDTWLNADEEALIHRHLDVILGDERMHEIGFAADMENWLAAVFARSTPRSHPYVQRLADHFGWRADAGNINQPHAIAWLADRALAFDFRDRVTQPSNKGYKAWVELTTPAMEGSRRGRAKHVRELLQTVRTKYPILESEFDWYRVRLWDPADPSSAQSSVGDVNWLTIILPIVFILTAIGRCSDADQPLTPEQVDREQAEAVELAEFDSPVRRRVTIDDALRRVGGEALTIDIVERSKPLVIEEMDRQLMASRSEYLRLDRAELSLTQALHQRVLGGLAAAPFALVRDFRASQAAVMLQLHRTDPERCLRFYSGEPVGTGLDMIDLREPFLLAQARLILETNAIAPAAPSRQFRYYDQIADEAASRAGMTRTRLIEIIGSGGSDADRCLALASFLAAAADGPRELTEDTLREF